MVRILLVGDGTSMCYLFYQDGVGKSSLVAALVKETFVPQLQHVLPEVTIPSDWSADQVPIHIVDSSSHLDNRQQLDAELRKADVIVLVYSLASPESFKRLGLFWLPYVRRLGRVIPIVLAGTHLDDRHSDPFNVEALMHEFKEIEASIECSAKTLVNIAEVFYFAQRVVLYPTGTLYDYKDQCLKPACQDALKRIFYLSDLDKNGLLDDDEMIEFQTKCFGTPLPRQELVNIKELIKEHYPQGVQQETMTLEGFLYLNLLFIQKGRIETTWTILRKFGYGNDLSLREDFLRPSFPIPHDCTVEMSSDGYQFFIDLFQSFDRDKDGALSEKELEHLFSSSPGNPWKNTLFPDTTLRNEFGHVTLQGFLAQWSMQTLLDHKVTLSYLAYLGYPNETTSALKSCRKKQFNLKKCARSVFLCLVVGATGSGKTSLLKSHLGRPFESTYTGTQEPLAVVNTVEIGGVEKYLVLFEIPPKMDIEYLQSKSKMDMVDVVCFVYDSSDPNSFAHVANLKKRCSSSSPCLFLATKSDLDIVSQRYDKQPEVFCRELGLPLPISISTKEKNVSDITTFVTTLAMDLRPLDEHALWLNRRLWMAVAAGGAAMIMIWVIRWLK